MSDFSDYNGNDNYFYRRGRYAADWNVTAMTHEMQISAKSVSVANTENHIIPDRETRPVPNDHIYTANFQQFITGASTLCTWVWADIDYDFIRKNPASDFGGNIFLRPGNVIAHALAGLDGVRLAPEIRKFMDYEPEVAILYSPTATDPFSGFLPGGGRPALHGALFYRLPGALSVGAAAGGRGVRQSAAALCRRRSECLPCGAGRNAEIHGGWRTDRRRREQPDAG